jgi:hypothetical protein
VSERTVEELEGAYRLLCGAMLTHTARMLVEFREDGRSALSLPGAFKAGKKPVSYTKELARQREIARQWVNGGGLVKFSDCCEEIGVNPDQARKKLGWFVDQCRKNPVRSRKFVSPVRAARITKGYKP